MLMRYIWLTTVNEHLQLSWHAHDGRIPGAVILDAPAELVSSLTRASVPLESPCSLVATHTWAINNVLTVTERRPLGWEEEIGPAVRDGRSERTSVEGANPHRPDHAEAPAGIIPQKDTSPDSDGVKVPQCFIHGFNLSSSPSRRGD